MSIRYALIFRTQGCQELRFAADDASFEQPWMSQEPKLNPFHYSTAGNPRKLQSEDDRKWTNLDLYRRWVGGPLTHLHGKVFVSCEAKKRLGGGSTISVDSEALLQLSTDEKPLFLHEDICNADVWSLEAPKSSALCLEGLRIRFLNGALVGWRRGVLVALVITWCLHVENFVAVVCQICSNGRFLG